MNQLDNILQYKLILQTQGPVFIGTGSKLSKTEYCFLPKKKVISVLDDNKFINFLVEKN
jgi:CRISPR/Cas system CSM-associated protein Csm5 (group 7 of RAMP superfamily)